MDSDTIVALATPAGRAGIAVIKISGDNTEKILKKLIRIRDYTFIPQKAKYHKFKNNKQIIDDGLMIFFKSPNSYTGEDVAELSIHSNPFIIDKMIETIIEYGARQALNGEFTYRAFKNGKIDLIQAEAVNEMINSNSKFGQEMKFNNLEGKLSNLINSVKNLLINIGIKIESSIEFGEDQYLEKLPVMDELREINIKLNKILTTSRFNEILDNGFKITIAGKVNTGKSSLFNELVLENRSIVSDIPGTTRDFIDKKIFLNGFAYEINDIAGFNNDTKDIIEDEGIKRSMDKVNESDAIIFLLDSSRDIDENDTAIYNFIKGKKHIIIANKKDISDKEKFHKIKKVFSDEDIVWVSVKNNENMDVILDFLKNLSFETEKIDTVFSVNMRQKSILMKLNDLIAGIIQLDDDDEIIAENIRKALDLIGELTGEVSTDDILNKIFSTFCIGK